MNRRILERLNSIERQMRCLHDWRPARSTFMGCESFFRECYRCDLKVQVKRPEYIELCKKEANEA